MTLIKAILAFKAENMKKVYYSLVSIFLFSICNAQKTNHFTITPGLYFGSEISSIDENILSGYFLFRKDSTFLFMSNESDINKKESIKDAFSGNWFIKKTDLILYFKQLQFSSQQLLLNEINYLSETRNSIDSVYLSGKVIDSIGNPLSAVSVILPEIDKACVTNKEGIYNCQITNDSKVTRVVFKYVLGGTINVPLLPNHNYHVINVSMPAKGRDFSFLTNNKRQYYFTKNKKDTFYFANFNLFPIKKEEFFDTLSKSRKANLLYKNFYDSLEKEVSRY